MPTPFSLSPTQSYLSNYRLPSLIFPEGAVLPQSMQEVMPALLQTEADPRLRSLRLILGDNPALPDEEEGALNAALAASYLHAGDLKRARRHAERSLAAYGAQWASHRIIIDVMMVHQDYEQAYTHLNALPTLKKTPGWDHALTTEELETCAAACAWRMKMWDEVGAHLARAFPDGPSRMPASLQEDYFRLALYRDQPEEAGRVAALLMATSTLDFTDALLQTLVQQGWTHQALPLYRNAYLQDPRNQLLRRRLVALCIREGKIEEARRLTAPGALDMNARATP